MSLTFGDIALTLESFVRKYDLTCAKLSPNERRILREIEMTGRDDTVGIIDVADHLNCSVDEVSRVEAKAAIIMAEICGI